MAQTIVIQGTVMNKSRMMVNVQGEQKDLGKFTLAHSDYLGKDENGKAQYGPSTYYQVALWEDDAKFVDMLEDGMKVQVEGSYFTTSTYKKKDGGTGVNLNLNVRNPMFNISVCLGSLPGAPVGGNRSSQNSSQNSSGYRDPEEDTSEFEDIPF